MLLVNYKYLRDTILDQASHVPCRIVCPECRGGSSGELCMSVYRMEGWRIAATCHRANCDLQTVFCTDGVGLRDVYTEQTPTPPKVAEGVWASAVANDRINPAGVRERLGFYVKAYISLNVVERFVRMNYANEECFYIRLVDANGNTAGVVERHFGDSARLRATRGLAKAHNTFDSGFDGMGRFFPSTSSGGTVVLVEDCLSAMALCSAGVNAVSLNGTSFGIDRYHALGSWDRIVLCLDADATRVAVSSAAKINPRVPTMIEVRRLVTDFKDMQQDTLDYELGRIMSA
jgi:hypothetical protein